LVAAAAAPDHHSRRHALATLADVRALIGRHLPAEYRSKFAWRQLAGLLRPASTALWIVLQLEGVKRR
jgi:hypothetical protein